MIQLPRNNPFSHIKKEKEMQKGYYIRGGIIYVRGYVDECFYRRSTGLSASRKNISFIAKKSAKILNEIIFEENQTHKTLKDFGLEVIESGSSYREAETTKTLISKFDREILPYFKHLDFDEITPLKIESWQNYLCGKLDISTARKYINLLKKILKKAVANNLLDKNPYDSVEMPQKKKIKKPRPIYSHEEMQKMLTTAKGWLKAFLLVAFSTGIRSGEMYALTWDDVDFKNKKIHVNKSIRKGKVKNTKTNKDRYVYILDCIVDELLLLYKYRKSDTWIFPTKDGKPFYDSKNFLKYHFKPLLKECSIEYKTQYVTRHSFATFMISGGMDILFVQHTLGHASAETTLKFYALYSEKEVDENKLNRANNIIKNSPNFSTLLAQERFS